MKNSSQQVDGGAGEKLQAAEQSPAPRPLSQSATDSSRRGPFWTQGKHLNLI